MKTTNALALSALLVNSLVAAYPSKRHEHLHKKRNLVVVTEDVYETVYSTTTIWVDPTPAGGEFYEHHAPTSKVLTYEIVPTSAAPTVQNAAPSSSSVYVAPSSVESPAPSSSTPVVSSSSTLVASPSSTLVASPSSTSVASPSSTSVASPSSTPVASSSSVYVAPSSVYVAPSSTEATSTAASSTAAASTPSATTASSSGTYSGDVTYYNPAGGYGACGFTIADSDHVVAIPHDTWDTKGTMSNGNPWCGTSITILNKSTGKTYPAKIGDKCMGTDAVPCTGGSLDLPQGFFDEAFPGVDGRGKGIMEWSIAA